MSRALPPDFVSRLEAAGLSDIVSALISSEPSLAVRVNSRRATLVADGERVPWLPDSAVYLDSRPVFAADPAWHQGLYYVQDASSMAMTKAVAHIAATYFDNRPLRYLDACAAPGGKTIAALEALPQGSVVLANEADRRRADILVENTAKYDACNVAVSCLDAARLGKEKSLEGVFDIVAVDAPCSGEGMMRKEPEAIRQWSPALIDACAAEQGRLVEALWPLVATGGVVIYSTCTFNTSENEDIATLLAGQPDAEPIALPFGTGDGVAPAIGTDLPCYRFFPGRVRGEGLFMAAVRKNDDGRRVSFKGDLKGQVAAEASAFVRRHCITDGMRLVDINGTATLIPEAHAGLFAALRRLPLLSCGLPVCTAKGHDIIPMWALAYSPLLRRDSFAAIELDRRAALAYLHGDSLTDIPADMPRGIALVSYHGAPLGFIKNVGRRANNLYPAPLRLRLDPTQAADAPLPLICLPR